MKHVLSQLPHIASLLEQIYNQKIFNRKGKLDIIHVKFDLYNWSMKQIFCNNFR